MNKEKHDDHYEGYQWWDEGLSAVVRVIILIWAGGILTLNYVTIPGWEQNKIDPTFIASVFTGTLTTFGVSAAKSNGNGNGSSKKKKEEGDSVSRIPSE
jgi:hypothetical protein